MNWLPNCTNAHLVRLVCPAAACGGAVRLQVAWDLAGAASTFSGLPWIRMHNASASPYRIITNGTGFTIHQVSCGVDPSEPNEPAAAQPPVVARASKVLRCILMVCMYDGAQLAVASRGALA